MADKKRTIVETIYEDKSKDRVAAYRYSDGTILFRNVRASYPHVLIAKEGTDDNGNPTAPTFSCTGLMSKRTHTGAMKMMVRLFDAMLAEHKIKKLQAERKCFRDGDLSDKEAYEGNWYISAREQKKNPPKVRDADGRTKLTAADDGKIYGGCWGHMLVRLWWQDNKFGKRINAGLVGFQFIRDDEPFGDATRVTDEDIDDTFDDEDEGGSGGGMGDDADDDDMGGL